MPPPPVMEAFGRLKVGGVGNFGSLTDVRRLMKSTALKYRPPVKVMGEPMPLSTIGAEPLRRRDALPSDPAKPVRAMTSMRSAVSLFRVIFREQVKGVDVCASAEIDPSRAPRIGVIRVTVIFNVLRFEKFEALYH